MQHCSVEHPCIASVLKNLGVICKKLVSVVSVPRYYISADSVAFTVACISEKIIYLDLMSIFAVKHS